MTIYLHAGTCWQRPDASRSPGIRIAIDGGRVSGVTAGFTAPQSDDLVIDLSDCFVLPGPHRFAMSTSRASSDRNTNWTWWEESPAAGALHARAPRAGDAGGRVHDCADLVRRRRRAMRSSRPQRSGKRICTGPAIFAPAHHLAHGGHGVTCGYRDDINSCSDAKRLVTVRTVCRVRRTAQVSRAPIHQIRRHRRSPDRHGRRAPASNSSMTSTRRSWTARMLGRKTTRMRTAPTA